MDDGVAADRSAHLPTLAGIEVVTKLTPEPRIVIDDSDRIRMVNQAAVDLLGHAPDDLVGRTFDVLVPPQRAAQVGELRRAWEAAPAPGALGRGMDLRARRADGTDVPVELQVTPVTTDDGPVVLVAMRDMTVLQHDIRLFRALLDAAPDAVVIVDEAGIVRMVNEAAERAFGYDRDELVGQPMEVLVPDRFAGRHAEVRKELFADPHARPPGRTGTLYAKRKDGSEFPVDISLAPVLTEEGPLVIADMRDLTERLADLEEMRRVDEQRRVLAETNRAKDQFLATVSHELRTPLASIIGFCELITDAEDLDPAIAHYASVIMRNAHREARLVDDLLTAVSIEDRGMTVRADRVDLAAVVRDAVESALPKAVEAGVRLTLAESPSTLAATCDGDRVGQAVDGLLSNALKFTPAGGRVEVRLEAAAATARIEVADSGIGIGDPEPHRVFERLYRSPTAVEREIPGAGLGLSIAAAIIAAHHGTIRVLHTGDTGTTFEIRLPLDGHPDPRTARDIA